MVGEPGHVGAARLDGRAELRDIGELDAVRSPGAGRHPVACVIVLLVGYAPWPAAWQAHLPGQFAATLRAVAAYMDEGLVTAWAAHERPDSAPGTAPARRSRLRRRASRSLSDLRAEYQRTMSEPPAVSRRASAWWPAVVGLEDVLDTTTTTVVAIGRGAAVPAPEAVYKLTGALRAVADAIETAVPPPSPGGLPSDPALAPVTAAVRSVFAVLTPGETGEAVGDAAFRSG